MAALTAAAALGLAACGNGDDGDTGPAGDTGTANDSSDSGDNGDAGDPDDAGGENISKDGSGSLTFDGEELALENVVCAQVAVEGGAWRVLADIEGTDGADHITINEGGLTTFYVDGVRWSNRGGDENTPQLDIGEHGATGDNGMYSEGNVSNHEEDVDLSADISC